jgi:hypothetical protein
MQRRSAMRRIGACAKIETHRRGLSWGERAGRKNGRGNRFFVGKGFSKASAKPSYVSSPTFPSTTSF